jgi:hypothetical protein
MANNSIETLFSTKVYGTQCALALNALCALETCVIADILCGPVAPETVPFVRPQRQEQEEKEEDEGTRLLYVADTLTWRFYHMWASCVVHAINNKAYGTALGRALYEGLFGFAVLEPLSVDNVREAVLSVRRTLRALPG